MFGWLDRVLIFESYKRMALIYLVVIIHNICLLKLAYLDKLTITVSYEICHISIARKARQNPILILLLL